MGAEQTTSFELLGLSGGRDEKGICSLTVPYFVATIDKVFPAAGFYLGLPETGRSIQANPDGTFTVHVTYEGSNSDGGSLPGREKPVYTLNTTFEEEAIEAHPKINELVDKYGGEWSDGRVTFPSKYAPAVNNSSGLSMSSSGDAKSNPMHGVEKYKKLSVQWEVAYAASVIPADIIAKVGTVISSPPGNPPKVEGRTKWLVMPPTATKKGNVVDVKETYFLLDQDVAPELYSK